MAKKKIYTKQLGKSVAVSARQSKSGKYHVIVGDSKNWTVVADGNTRATRVFPTREEAIHFAKETANKIQGEVIVHNKLGEIVKRVPLAK